MFMRYDDHRKTVMLQMEPFPFITMLPILEV